MIEVDFYKCKDVEAAWQLYKNHLNDSAKAEEPAWHEKRDNLLAKLLFQMGRVLGFDMPAIEIFQGGYAPSGWAFKEGRISAVMEYLFALSEGKTSLPMKVVSFPVDEDTAAAQAEYLKLLTKQLREGKPWPIEIVREGHPAASSD
jgi:hypothetical protein